MTPNNSRLSQAFAHEDPRAVQIQHTRAVLQEHLLLLSFHGFEEVVRELLTRLGYSDARLLGRTQWRQFTRHGGSDMEALARVGVTGGRILLQVKQYKRVVSRRFVDELAGVLVRSSAQEGIIITTSRFSKVAHSAAEEHSVVPIRIIDGEELIDLLLRHRLGVWSERRDGEDWFEPDHAYFRELHARYPTRKNRTCAQHAPAAPVAIQTKPPPIQSCLNPHSTHMLWRTHMLAGISSLWLVTSVPGALTTTTIPLAVIMASLGSLLPDLDAADSRIRHVGAFGITPFAPVSTVLHRTLGHRGLLHSPVMLIPIAAVAAGLSSRLGPVAGIALWLGYGSHLVMDALTKSGISLLPFSRARLHLPPPPLRIVTGGTGEDVLMIVLALAATLLLLHFLAMS